MPGGLAVMVAVLEDISTIREKLKPSAGRISPYQVRQQINIVAFADLRGGFLRFGGLLTANFLRLERAIGDFAAAWGEFGDRAETSRIGRAIRPEEPERIELQAKHIRHEATNEMKRRSDLLAATETSA
jgi:hypothetical protein